MLGAIRAAELSCIRIKAAGLRATAPGRRRACGVNGRPVATGQVGSTTDPDSSASRTSEPAGAAEKTTCTVTKAHYGHSEESSDTGLLLDMPAAIVVPDVGDQIAF